MFIELDCIYFICILDIFQMISFCEEPMVKKKKSESSSEIFQVTQNFHAVQSKIPFDSKRGRFCKENFFVIHIYVILTLSNTNQRLSLYHRLWNNHKLQETVFAKSVTFGVKGILLPLVPTSIIKQWILPVT